MEDGGSAKGQAVMDPRGAGNTCRALAEANVAALWVSCNRAKSRFPTVESTSPNLHSPFGRWGFGKSLRCGQTVPVVFKLRVPKRLQEHFPEKVTARDGIPTFSCVFLTARFHRVESSRRRHGELHFLLLNCRRLHFLVQAGRGEFLSETAQSNVSVRFDSPVERSACRPLPTIISRKRSAPGPTS